MTAADGTAGSQGTPNVGVMTVERGLQVLRAFRSDRMPLSNAEIVRRTRLPKATVSRLTTTLMQLGYLRHVPEGRQFELGTAALRIGHAYAGASRLTELANPLLQEVADRLGVSVALSMRDGVDILYLGYKASERVATLRMGVGTVLPIGVTAGGHAYLWGMSSQERGSLVAELQRRAADPARLDQILRGSFAELDATGTCALFGEYQRDVYAAAVPIHAGRERVLMALSCGKVLVQPDLAAERRRIAPVLREASVQLEGMLSEFDGQP